MTGSSPRQSSQGLSAVRERVADSVQQRGRLRRNNKTCLYQGKKEAIQSNRKTDSTTRLCKLSLVSCFK